MMTSLIKASVVQVVLPIIVTCFVVDESTLETQFFIQQKKKEKKKCVVFASPSLSHVTINMNFQKIIFLVKGVIIFLQELCF